MSNKIFSLLNYVGHKSKLLDQILPIFPQKIEGEFWDIFCGSCVVGLSSDYEKVNFVDTNKYLIDLYSNLTDDSFKAKLENMIVKYNLTNSSKKRRSEYLKTGDIGTCMWHGKEIPNLHLDKLNQSGYDLLLKDFNCGIYSDPIDIGIAYMILTLYGRNSNVTLKVGGGLSGAVGPLDFSIKASKKLEENISAIKSKNIKWINGTYDSIIPSENDFVYLDPPYLASSFKYGKWDEKSEKNLLDWIDNLKCEWVLSNVFTSGKNSNTLLQEWSKKYKVIELNKQYRKWAAKGKSSAKKDSKENKEVLITNI